ncbi:LytR/AlgR family response regulator transcription factor [Dinghuibacter silviterrae]|uniref:LytTR family two component transcriptional regulator n=1 Tax=Dinghuibacter silviterrae TaxID=1539049 RepID=A0A4R8DR94_9BACT|nr:LytTR family DNA-binding domain-containing protein [Dinghuibacter silviterrae]TDX00489.1 LytTR family two component transcriptional regulator [Dinghuibacter silviterrae]
MIRCLLVDDEQAAIEILKIYLEKTPFLSLAGSTTSPIEALHILTSQNIDLVFLDIHMPDITGLELIKAMPLNTLVILTTAYPDYALDGYDLNIVDYLLKPISLQRFMKAATKALKMHTAENHPKGESLFVEEDHVFVKTEQKGRLIKIYFKDIKYVEGMKNYIAFHWSGGKTLTLHSLSELEKILPSAKFMRIHKSYIVALDEIDLVDAGEVVLRGSGTRIPFGVTYKEAFLNRIKSKLL